MMPKIEQIYAFIAEDTGPDDEGVTGFATGMGWMPMVGADIDRIESLKPIAQQIAKSTGKKIKLIKFTNREEVETIS